MATLVLTVLGDDRPGLVSSVSAPISAHGASWERSQLARLAGQFAGIVLVSIAEDRLEALVADLEGLDEPGLRVAIQRTDRPGAGESVRLVLDLLGSDRPGIVATISGTLADNGVSIEELTTDVRDAPMAGGTVFEAHATLVAPADLDGGVLRAALEAIADELMVEIRLSED